MSDRWARVPSYDGDWLSGYEQDGIPGEAGEVELGVDGNYGCDGAFLSRASILHTGANGELPTLPESPNLAGPAPDLARLVCDL